MDRAEYLKEAILRGLATFADDPPDSDYQEGYRDALLELARIVRGGPMFPLDGPSRQKPKPTLRVIES